MTFDRLTLINFQKHKKLSIQLNPHVTVLTGFSDSGKSSIIRALRWLARNQPGGDSFIRYGEDFTKVSLDVDGECVIRSRGKGLNTYALGAKDFSAFGTGVPEKVTALLNLSDVSIQLQHEPSFWLSLSSGEAAKRLNEIVNLEAIDKALAEAASRVKRVKNKLEVSRERLKDAEDKASRLKWVEKAWRDFVQVEALRTELDEVRRKQSALASIIKEIGQLTRKLQGAKRAVVAARAWIYVGEQLLEAWKKTYAVSELIVQVEKQQAEVNRLRIVLEAAESKLASQTEYCPMCGKKWKK